VQRSDRRERKNMRMLGLFVFIAAGLLTGSTGADDLTIQGDSAAISGPFVITNGYVYQAVRTAVTKGGRACYSFALTNAGSYVIQAKAKAPGTGSGSFYINMDAEPQAEMIWDIPASSGFERRLVSWRGNGTPASPQFARQVFNLAVGPHRLIIRGREPNTQLKELSVLQLPSPPTNLRIIANP